MSISTKTQPRRLKAAIIGLGLDGGIIGGPRRILAGEHCVVVGGSADTHADLAETMLRLEVELHHRGKELGEVSPDELADIAWRIDSSELLDLALRLKEGLERRNALFEELSPEELTELSIPRATSA